jgi:hypothetical protein
MLCIAAAFAVTNDTALFHAWQIGELEGKFGRARVLLRDSTKDRRIDAAATPGSIFGDTLIDPRSRRRSPRQGTVA